MFLELPRTTTRLNASSLCIVVYHQSYEIKIKDVFSHRFRDMSFWMRHPGMFCRSCGKPIYVEKICRAISLSKHMLSINLTRQLINLPLLYNKVLLFTSHHNIIYATLSLILPPDGPYIRD